MSYHQEIEIVVLEEFFNRDWKLALGEIILHVRRARSLAGFELMPQGNPQRPELMALLASTLHYLAHEQRIGNIPVWITAPYSLDHAWFPAGLKSMRAMAIAESPLEFRRNDIFILRDLFDRC
jgi:hypothetical protein